MIISTVSEWCAEIERRLTRTEKAFRLKKGICRDREKGDLD
jgi:hypothetical protein